MDIHQLIAAIVPDVFCGVTAGREVKNILDEAAKRLPPSWTNEKAARCRVAFLIKIPANSLVVPEFFQCRNQAGQQNVF